MEKYYTPEIEEFHVGFEYEIFTTNCNITPSVNEWIKDTTLFRQDTLENMLQCVEPPIRVKYLDKEDIESLGFKELANNWFFKDAPGKLAYWTQVIIDFRWMEKEKPYKDISILGARGKEDDIIFRGNIKNKSELKKLLKQLNIK